MKPWQRIDTSPEQIGNGHLKIVRKQFIMNNGVNMTADIIDTTENQAAIVVALTVDKQVVIARQFRCGPERVLDELPGGLVDNGETPEQAAQRELQEETGYAVGAIEYLGMAYVNAWSNIKHHYFIATDCTLGPSAPNPDKYEEIEVDTISIDACIQNAETANMTDAVAVLLAKDTLREIQVKVA